MSTHFFHRVHQSTGVDVKRWLALALLACSATASNAAIIFAAPQNITADTDVVTTGTLFQALSAGNAATINGVPFLDPGLPTGGQANPVTYTNLKFINLDQINVNAFAPNPNVTGPAYANMMSAAMYGSAGPATIEILNLTPNTDYLVQLWVNDPRGTGRTQEVASAGGNSATMLFGGASGVSGQFITGTFTAGSSGSESFTLTGSTLPQLNAIQIRAVPEPGTSAIVLSSLAVLGFMRRRRAH
jgi:hypothetical protein